MTRLRFGLVAALFALVGCDNPGPKKPPAAADTSPTVDERNTKYRPDQGTLRNVLRTGQRGAARVDFDQLKTLIFALDLQENRMPTADAIKADLKANPDARVLLKKINDGVIVLTGTTDRQAMWAYEIDADKAGGIVILGGNVTDANADDVKKSLGQK